MTLDTEKVPIYIPLLNEGSPTLRPTLGEVVEDSVFRVLSCEDYDPEDEEWEFPPGKIVRCVTVVKEGRAILVATEEYR
jgi:hypothetical protein